MKQTTIKVAKRTGGSVTMTAYESETPGLVVHRRLVDGVPDTKLWTVSHRESGHRIADGFFRTREKAKEFAGMLKGAVDWTLPYKEFVDDGSMRQKAAEAVRRLAFAYDEEAVPA